MDCEQSRKNGWIQRYLAGQLTADEAQEFEMHIMNCDACFQDVRAEDKLASFLRSADSLPLAAKPKPHFALPFNRRWCYSLLLISGIVLAAVVVLLQRTGLEKNFAPLARIEAPVYIPSQNRAPASSARFQRYFDAGMNAYQKKQYPQAARELQLAVQLSPDNPKAGYYLGVSCLLAGNLEAAAGAFQRVLNLKNACIEEDCRWFLANTYLRMGKTKAALEQLQWVFRLNQDHRQQAREIIRAIDPHF